jgi:hypothetical protein
LRVRDVDAIFRQRKGGFDEELSKVAIPGRIMTPGNTVSLIPTTTSMTAKIISPKDNGTFVPLTNLDNSVSNIRILDARSINTNSTSLLNIGKNIKVSFPLSQRSSICDRGELFVPLKISLGNGLNLVK